jgi:[ribosomal protein S5]-alanine N-acetyltransferase
MTSERLRYQPVGPEDLDRFHELLQDAHVRRYLLDGKLFPREWTRDRIANSQALFQRRGVGLWLAEDRASGALVGFCGFLEILELHPEPQIVYALPERFTGRGHASEMARACIDHARTQPGFAEIIGGVDEVNAASVRVLEKLGFQRFATRPGNFGNVFLLRLPAP